MTSDIAWATLPSPIGPITVITTSRGVVRVAFGELADHPGDSPGDDSAAHQVLCQARTELSEYFAGDRTGFDVAIDWSGSTGWQLAVRQALHASVKHGHTVSYGELAALAGRPDGARAVGGIMAGNPIPVIVACHRVVSADGGLGGFAGSGGAMVETKRKLLELEGSAAPTLFDL